MVAKKPKELDGEGGTKRSITVSAVVHIPGDGVFRGTPESLALLLEEIATHVREVPVHLPEGASSVNVKVEGSKEGWEIVAFGNLVQA